MKKARAFPVLIMLGGILSAPAFLHAEDAHQHKHDTEPATGGAVQAAPAEMAALADGEIRKVDKEAGKLTIKHGEIRSLNMPPMTMVFYVSDRAMLDKVQVGDKVKFAVTEENSKMMITELHPQQ